jgi:hypothetical protein
VDAVPAVIGPWGRPGRPRQRPAKLHADMGCDSRPAGGCCGGRGITSRIARRGVESITRLDRHRWKVERSLAWLLANRRRRSAMSAAPTSSKRSCTWPAPEGFHRCERPLAQGRPHRRRRTSAIRSATASTGRCVLARGIVGRTEASATNKLVNP